MQIRPLSSLIALLHRFPGWQTAAIALVLSIILAFVSQHVAWKSVELKGFDLLTVLSAPKKSTLPIILVGIDDASLAELQKRWPWPRSIHAQLIDTLKAAGAAVIAFDVVFDFPTDKNEDEALANAVKYAGNVVLAAGMVKQDTGHGTVWMRKDPIPLFTDNGAAAGLVNLAFDRDQAMRRIPDNQDAFWRQIVAKLQAALPDAHFDITLKPESMIRYVGPTGIYPRISYYQALDPARYLPNDELLDSLVIIGRDTRSASDIGAAQVDTFATPFYTFGGEMMPGAEIHANILENVLSGKAINEAPPWASHALLAMVMLLAALLMRRFHPLFSALAGIALIAVATLLAGALFIRFNIWLPAGISLLGVALLYVTQALLAFTAERKQKMVVKRIFSRYVPEEVVNELAAHPERLKLGGEHREMTLMFTDLANFTTLSEKLAPEQAADLINRYLTEMNRVIFRYGGTIDKFIGDAVMAFWNAPLYDPEHALHAVQATCEMQASMVALNQRLAADSLPELKMRIGVHTGVALVGNMGSEIGRLNYTAIGDAVNLASRLEGANKFYHSDILLSAATAEKLGGQVSLRRVDLIYVKGKLEPVEVWTPCATPALADTSNQAILAYRKQNWETSRDLWRKNLLLDPEDHLAQIYLDRIDAYQRHPPPDGWDGGTVLDSK